MSVIIRAFYVLISVILWQTDMSSAQNDYTDPITCYTCEGTAVNSTCADPLPVKKNTDLIKKECGRGICLKWTFYRGGTLFMQRTCSSDLNFHLTMIDGVCRTERNGNGYLCMCGRNLCNGSTRPSASPRILFLLLVCYTLISQRRLLWTQ
ncbi:protein quiver-like isoform X2 [Gigantopelta aegis]|uniref:protein quiver-like isoform X2 n=1 Tax=Gigantopelta aegis TaxID=1735272 RepID=UPI001B88B9D1|nr:protein quiver-like isoform X2 [Gigantopelta aegis]